MINNLINKIFRSRKFTKLLTICMVLMIFGLIMWSFSIDIVEECINEEPYIEYNNQNATLVSCEMIRYSDVCMGIYEEYYTMEKTYNLRSSNVLSNELSNELSDNIRKKYLNIRTTLVSCILNQNMDYVLEEGLKRTLYFFFYVFVYLALCVLGIKIAYYISELIYGSMEYMRNKINDNIPEFSPDIV
jgi:hypothetical protein